MKTRILVIEDNAANMELMTYLLQAHGCATLKAGDGKEGLAVAARERPDLIICDIQLPLLNGYEVARRIKADPALNGIPLLAITAFAMADDRDKTLAAGFDGYFPKPIAPETFVQEVQAFLRPELRAAAASAVSAAVDAPPSRRGGRKLLVVDDRPANLQLAASLLGGSGYDVITAAGMGEALRLARENLPDLIMSDVIMGNNADGYDFIKAVKAEPRLSSIPFIFITSTVTSESGRRKGLALGAARYLFRPMEPQDLLREIEACLRESAKG